MRATCVTCGNEYDKAFEIVTDDERLAFDSFECAIQRLAPVCNNCGCRIIGHGVENDGTMFCGAHCAARSGVEALSDRA